MLSSCSTCAGLIPYSAQGVRGGARACPQAQALCRWCVLGPLLNLVVAWQGGPALDGLQPAAIMASEGSAHKLPFARHAAHPTRLPPLPRLLCRRVAGGDQQPAGVGAAGLQGHEGAEPHPVAGVRVRALLLRGAWSGEDGAARTQRQLQQSRHAFSLARALPRRLCSRRHSKWCGGTIQRYLCCAAAAEQRPSHSACLQNMLVCAPTGAGKTNVAMLTMLHEIGLHR